MKHLSCFNFQKVCNQLNLPNNLVYYFALFLVKKEGNEINGKF